MSKNARDTIKLNKYRPYLELGELDATIQALESVLREKILSAEVSTYMLRARTALKKVRLNADAGIGVAYKKIAPEDRVRRKDAGITIESLGGELETELEVNKSDSQKLAEMSELDQEIFWVKANIEIGLVSKDEGEVAIRVLRAMHNKEINTNTNTNTNTSDYISGVKPTDVMYSSGEVRSTTDSELFAALEKIEEIQIFKNQAGI